jgi:PPK2 family polyphosphate:nucleotide phosphotransferase
MLASEPLAMPKGPSAIITESPPPTLESVDLSLSLDEAEYEAELKAVQKQLLAIQQAYFHQNRRAIVVFEGWDASGKGGTIRRLTEKLDPRGFRVHPIAAPSQDEKQHHYLYRFFRRLPKAGSIAIFDRSYYGRVLVERVRELASKDEWQRAYQEINEFERLLMDDGVRIIKLFLHIDPDEQLKRFSLRLRSPVKRWKLTEEDLVNRQQWQAYHKAINRMFRKTSTEAAPWHVLPANHKWYVRIKALQIIAEALAEGVDLSPPPLDEALIKAAEQQLGITLPDDEKDG